MKKDDVLEAFEDIEPDILDAKPKYKEITKLFLQGVPYNEIAVKYGLSVTRIREIVAREARRARLYKKQKNDMEYQELLIYYTDSMKEQQIKGVDHIKRS